MKIFLTGATGYLGRFVLNKLVKEGHQVKCLARNTPQLPQYDTDKVEWITGDIMRLESLQNHLAGCDAVVNLVAIIDENKRKGITFEKVNFQTTQNLINAAKELGIKRFIQMSAFGADINGTTKYFRTKGKGEEAVTGSGLVYTIFKPSFIFGYNHPVFTMLAKTLKMSPFGLMPVFGDGLYRHQPVFVENVAELVAQSLQNPKTENKIYDVGGPEQLTYRKQIEIIAHVIGKKVRPIPVPLGFSEIMVRLVGVFPSAPINSDKLTMLIQDNICDNSNVQQDFNIDLVSFENGLKTMA